MQRMKNGSHSYLTAGKGLPIILLHGIPGSAYTWEAVAEQLAEQFQVIIPDLLGFGQSDLPPEDFYTEAQARALLAFVNTLDIDRFYLCAHDYGAPVGLTMLRLQPDIEVIKMVLSSTNTFTDTYIPLPLRIANVPGLSKLFFRLVAGNTLGLNMMYWAATKNKTSATANQFKRHLTPSAMNYTWRIFERSLSDLKRNYQLIENSLSQINIDTLILWGDSDPFFAVDVGQRIVDHMPKAHLKVYQQTGHFVPEEQPLQVAKDVVHFFPIVAK